MSSRAYEAVEIDVSGGAVAERMSRALEFASACSCIWGAFHWGGAAAAVPTVLLAALLAVPRRRPARLSLCLSGSGAVQLREAGQPPVQLSPGRGSRLLGPLVVLDCRPAGVRASLWLTPWDVSPEHHRRLRVCLAAGN